MLALLRVIRLGFYFAAAAGSRLYPGKPRCPSELYLIIWKARGARLFQGLKYPVQCVVNNQSLAHMRTSFSSQPVPLTFTDSLA